MSNSTNNIQIQFNYLDVENCFKNFYVVPDYQREYVWTEVQINQLLDDIYEEFDFNPNKESFLHKTNSRRNCSRKIIFFACFGLEHPKSVRLRRFKIVFFCLFVSGYAEFPGLHPGGDTWLCR